MRIAQITHSYKPIIGGADVYAELLRSTCEGAGHEVAVYQRPVPGDVDDPAVRQVAGLARRLMGPRGEFWTVPLGLGRLRGELAAYDALVAHYPNHHLMVEWHPRTVLISHGVFWDDHPQALRSRLKRALARRAYRKARRVVANDTFFLRQVGEDVAPGVEPFSEVAPGRFFIPNCIDVKQFAPCEPRADLMDRQVILVPRNLYVNRGVHLAIEAFARFAPAAPEAQLVVVGAEGQRGYLEHCRDLAARENVADRVTFLGPVPWPEMPSVYSGADLTVIPTLCGEGTSLAALEAMACGSPTVSTNVAGLADLPTLQADPTPGALSEVMATVWQDREGVAASQQEVVRRVYNLDNWRQAWLGILEGLPAARGRT